MEGECSCCLRIGGLYETGLFDFQDFECKITKEISYFGYIMVTYYGGKVKIVNKTSFFGQITLPLHEKLNYI